MFIAIRGMHYNIEFEFFKKIRNVMHFPKLTQCYYIIFINISRLINEVQFGDFNSTKSLGTKKYLLLSLLVTITFRS